MACLDQITNLVVVLWNILFWFLFSVGLEGILIATILTHDSRGSIPGTGWAVHLKYAIVRCIDLCDINKILP